MPSTTNGHGPSASVSDAHAGHHADSANAFAALPVRLALIGQSLIGGNPATGAAAQCAMLRALLPNLPEPDIESFLAKLSIARALLALLALIGGGQ